MNGISVIILNRKQFGCILSETGEKQRTNNNQNRSTERLIRNGRKLNLETILTRQFVFGKILTSSCSETIFIRTSETGEN